MKKENFEKIEAKQSLRKLGLNAGDTVYTILKHVSSSGMLRVIDVYMIKDNKPVWITPLVSKIIGVPRDKKREGLRVGGCGMDMGFHVVYGLSSQMFEKFICIGESCRSNDHFNGDENREPHEHSDGGYALRHEWM